MKRSLFLRGGHTQGICTKDMIHTFSFIYMSYIMLYLVDVVDDVHDVDIICIFYIIRITYIIASPIKHTSYIAWKVFIECQPGF